MAFRHTPVERRGSGRASRGLRGRAGRLAGRSGIILLAAAAALGAAALATRNRARRVERANPPLGRFMSVDGVRLHYLERGQGDAVVLLHGNGSMIEDFVLSGLVERAARRYWVIAFDRPGYGHSTRPRNRIWTPRAQADLLRKALGRLGVEKTVLLGHSWGALVALAMALDHPARIRGLALLSGYYFPTLRIDAPLLGLPAIPGPGDVIRYTIAPLLGRVMLPLVLRRLFAPAPVPTRFDAFPIAMSLRPSQIRASAAESALLIPAVIGLRRRYAAFRGPVAIMAGDGDRLVDFRRQSVRLRRRLRGSRLILVRQAGHMVHQSAPEQAMAAIDIAADRLDAPGGGSPREAAFRPGHPN